MKNTLTMELLVKALRDNPEMYVGLVAERLYYHIDMADDLYYLENDEDNIDLIAESRDLTTKDMLRLGVYNDYDPNADYVNSNLEVITTAQLAELYIDCMEDIWELLDDEDKKEIGGMFDQLARDTNSISYMIAGPEEEIESLISIAEDIAINRIMGNEDIVIKGEEVNGAHILYKDGCLHVIKRSDKNNKEKLMKVRKEVSEYATWVKYYYPNGEEELVYHKAN